MKPTIVCGQCQKPLAAGARFCSNCGSAVEWTSDTQSSGAPPKVLCECHVCGAENDPSNRMCTACGTELLPPKTVQQSNPKGPRKKRVEAAAPPTWKIMAGLVAFLAVGVVILQLMTTKKVEGVPQQEQSEERPASNAPNMEALPQIEELEKRVKANQSDDTQLLQLANVLHDNHFYDRAIQRYKEYLRKHGNDIDARVDLGICYYESDRTGDARQEMLKALQSNPNHVLGNFNLGIVNLRIAQAEMTSGNTEQANRAIKEANEWFRKTVTLDPNGSAGQRAQRLLSEHGQSTKLQTN